MLLAIDSSTQTIGLALFNGEQVIAEQTWISHRHHTMELAPAVDGMLQRSAIDPSALKVIGVALGPGSFTCLRIGLAFAKGLALSQHLALVGIPGLDILAAGQPASELPMLALLNAGRGRLAAAHYQYSNGKWTRADEPQIRTAEQLAQSIRTRTYICGEMNADERQTLARKWKNAILATPALCVRRPAVLAELAWARFQKGDVDEPISLAPQYLHIAEAIPA
jgi:tRNA threonylcarbamoyladenosine biosynthesis protein TsaB